MGPEALRTLLEGFSVCNDPSLLVGLEGSDDACVYRLTDELAIIQTVDFFAPMVDDPYIFGRIAAVNALSDVYAMGGTPRLAMNLLCLPDCLPESAARDILRGGRDAADEAGCTVAGGHTVTDKEPKYGMSVMGVVHPSGILRNTGAEVGDLLVLTKPLGSGIITTAEKAGEASSETLDFAIKTMSALNRAAGEAAVRYGAHACTDVTGFGLLGHLCEMAGDAVTMRLRSNRVPFMPEADELASMGLIPAGAYRNYEFVKSKLMGGCEQTVMDILCDPQTSGGLLIAVPAENAGELARSLDGASIVGEVLPRMSGSVLVE